MNIIPLFIIGIIWREDFNIDGYYWHPEYTWRAGSARRPPAAERSFPRTGDKRFGDGVADERNHAMETLLESPPVRGRPPGAVKCVETGEIFDTCDLAAAWLSSVGVQILAQTVRNAPASGNTCGGFHWQWVFPVRKPGPMKGRGGRPPKGQVRPIHVVPRTPVCCPDSGECYRDAEVAAEIMRASGLPAEAKGIVQAVMSGESYAGRYWDWRGRAIVECGVQAQRGCKCAGCAERMGTFMAAEVPAMAG